MTNMPRELYSAEQSRELDRIAIEEFGLPGLALMQRAGEAAFDVLMRHWGSARRIAVVCGGGNNGGDGYIVGACARRIGMDVVLMALADPVSEDARAAREQYLNVGGGVLEATPERLEGAELIVDAVFGTGLTRPAAGRWTKMLAAINRSQAPVLALDIPSGLQSDSGQALGEAVRATRTITFIGVKLGLLTCSGPEYSGELLFHDLGVPREVYEKVTPKARCLCAEELIKPCRPRDAHKGKLGHVLVAGGDQGMAGAAIMAAKAAARLGAGLVTVATRVEHARFVPLSQPELMTIAQPNEPQLGAAARRATVSVLGPGMGTRPWGESLFEQVLALELPTVVDADGLNLLARKPRQNKSWVLTPHPGEAARLLDCSVSQVQGDRATSVEEIAQRYGGICVLKGLGSLVSDGKGTLDLCDCGNAGMASGGMGDVLSGAIAALLAQGLSARDAARLAVWLHGKAADQEAGSNGEIGMLATDLLPHMRRLLQ